MPISSKRRRERGFNQCELLLEELKKLDIENKFTYTNKLLERKRHTARQTLKDKSGRRENVEGLFNVNEKTLEKIKLLHPELMQAFVLIIDDVVTTGSTIEEAIKIMRNAGFKNAWGLSVAH